MSISSTRSLFIITLWLWSTDEYVFFLFWPKVHIWNDFQEANKISTRPNITLIGLWVAQWVNSLKYVMTFFLCVFPPHAMISMTSRFRYYAQIFLVELSGSCTIGFDDIQQVGLFDILSQSSIRPSICFSLIVK